MLTRKGSGTHGRSIGHADEGSQPGTTSAAQQTPKKEASTQNYQGLATPDIGLSRGQPSTEDIEIQAVIIDSGASETKAGFAGDDNPLGVFPSIVGRPSYRAHAVNPAAKRLSIGESARRRRGILKITHPFAEQNLNWDDIEAVWRHTFYNVLRIAPENFHHPVLLTEHSISQEPVLREKTAQIMFETFKVPAMYLTDSAVLSLYATGRTTGLVLESGHMGTHAVPIYEGYKMPYGIDHTDAGGSEITDLLGKQMAFRGFYFNTSAERDILQLMKEEVCYVAGHPVGNAEQDYYLPDGQVIHLEAEDRCHAPELLFNTSLVGSSQPGIHELACTSIMKCNGDIIPDLYRNILLSGGTTKLPGLPHRLKKEIQALAPVSCAVKVEANDEYEHLAWTGGSILTSMSTFQQMWISENDYNEYGPSIVHRKCFQ